jgi:hypothetical protein
MEAQREHDVAARAVDGRAARLETWLPDDFEFGLALKREGDQWFALFMDFDVTGCGATRAAAITDAFGLLAAYLEAYFDDGADFSETLRPIQAWLRLRIRIESMIAKPLRLTALRLPLSDEATYELPAGLLPRFAS